MTATLMRRPAVLLMTGLSRSALYAQMQAGCFPRPVRIGARAVAWREADIAQWIQSRAAS